MKITSNEYQRRVYNMVLAECFSLLYAEVIGSKVNNESEAGTLVNYASHAKEIFIDQMKLETTTMTETIKRINESGSQFAQLVSALAEAVSKDRKEALKANEKEVDETPKDLNQYETEIIDKIFKERLSTANVEEVRDSITNAIVEEKTKAEEIKNVIDLDKSRSKDGTLSESVLNMTKKLPTSLLEAIYKSNMQAAYLQVDATHDFNTIIQNNKEVITEGSNNIYAIYETMTKFGFRTYTESEVQRMIIDYVK